MAILSPQNRDNHEQNKFLESSSVTGQVGVVVLNSDGSNIAGGTGTSANQVQGNVASAIADAGNPVKVGGKYLTTLPTFTNAQRGDLQIGTRGSLNTTLFAQDSATAASFGAASNVAAGTTYLNDLPVGQYNATAPVLTDTRYNNVQLDISGNLQGNLRTLLSGEDQTNNRIMTLPKYTYSAVALADVQIKGSPGILHSVTLTCNDAAPTAGSLIIYDSLTETGTQVFNHTFTTTPFVPTTINLDYNMLTGIYIGMTTTGDVNFSCSYL